MKSYYKTIFKGKVCNFHRGVTQSFGSTMSERDTEKREYFKKGVKKR